jgi:hypothetical protein|tara:strand:+ start:179 stop:1039 length:861 start_codon:yes stop_codon:yes gene_type:complete
MKKKFLLKNFTRLVFVIICLELIVRFLGIANGPLRLANKELGYIPQANQEGRFLYNHWTFNDLHMNSRNNFSYIGNEILILGDSVVWGGNRLDQKERIGWLINNLSGEKNTFVVAEQSWGFKNQILYIMKFEHLFKKVNKIIFVLNSGDFERPSSWGCSNTHPINKPKVHLYFALKKYVLRTKCPSDILPNLLVPDFQIEDGLSLIKSKLPSTSLELLLYQTKDEFSKSQSFKNKIAQYQDKFTKIHEIIDFKKNWGLDSYIDGIHLGKKGTKNLANIIYENFIVR